MIGAHAYGVMHNCKKLSKTAGPCMLCGQHSDCDIIRYEKVRHSFFITLRVLERRYFFNWEKCGHQAMLIRPQDVTRYRDEQEQTGLLTIPYYQGMQPVLGAIPKRPSGLIVALLVIGVILFWLIVYLVLDHFGLWPKFPVF